MKIDFEPREIFYQRTGNLSQVTTTNKEVAERFMRVSDLRRDIVIVDSDKKPEANAVAVGSDVLAWRQIPSLSELTKIMLKPQRFHQTEVVNDRYIVQIHDLLIQDHVRSKVPLDRESYNRQYLNMLRKEVTASCAEVLRWEKLGWDDQKMNYITDFVTLGLFLLYDNVHGHPFPNVGDGMGYLACHTVVTLGRMNIMVPLSKAPPRFRTNMTEFWLPFVPIDKWLMGRKYLAQYGNELIIPRS